VKVTIVTPSYHQGPFLEEAIRSVIEQDYPGIEYIVMDGGSQDNSFAVLQKYSGSITYWESLPDRGQAHAINKGLARATGELVGWLNTDDRLKPGAVQRAVDVFEREPLVDVVYGRVERIDVAGRKIPTPELPKDQIEFGPDTALEGCLVNQPGCFWRRAIGERVGGLDEALRYVMDYDYWLRILRARGRFWRLPAVQAEFRISRDSKTVGQAGAMTEEGIRLIERALADPQFGLDLGVDREQLHRQADRGRGILAMNAAMAAFGRADVRAGIVWIRRAIGYSPASLAERRWIDLAAAGIQRRLGRLPDRDV
jgi:glycosyltransferase involved in cell wall biosynthesis